MRIYFTFKMFKGSLSSYKLFWCRLCDHLICCVNPLIPGYPWSGLAGEINAACFLILSVLVPQFMTFFLWSEAVWIFICIAFVARLGPKHGAICLEIKNSTTLQC